MSSTHTLMFIKRRKKSPRVAYGQSRGREWERSRKGGNRGWREGKKKRSRRGGGRGRNAEAAQTLLQRLLITTVPATERGRHRQARLARAGTSPAPSLCDTGVHNTHKDRHRRSYKVRSQQISHMTSHSFLYTLQQGQ